MPLLSFRAGVDLFVRKMSLEDIVVCINLRPLPDSPFWLIDIVADHTGVILRHYRTESFLVGFELVSTSFGNLKAYFGHNGHEFILKNGWNRVQLRVVPNQS